MRVGRKWSLLKSELEEIVFARADHFRGGGFRHRLQIRQSDSALQLGQRSAHDQRRMSARRTSAERL